MDDIRVGLVGLGGRGLHWLRMVQGIDGYRVVAICDPIAPRLAAAEAYLTCPDEVARYPRYEQMLADDRVEAVLSCVRCREQGAIAAQALEAGKHCNSEVPAAHTIEDCWRIVVAAERSGLVYQLADQTRYWGYVEAWREIVTAGTLGHITYCEGEYFAYYPGQHYWDPRTGEFCPAKLLDDVAAHPRFEPNWIALMPPIHYLVHNLSPMLKVLDDRVTEVVGMGTRPQSYRHLSVMQSDLQVALMKTEKDCVLRMGASFLQEVPEYHPQWHRVKGTRGILQLKFSPAEGHKMYVGGAQMFDFAQVDWRFTRRDAPSAAIGSGHGDADYYPHLAFREAVLRGTPLEWDVYRMMDTAAPAILAADSIERESARLTVPDFRPGPLRAAGEWPEGMG